MSIRLIAGIGFACMSMTGIIFANLVVSMMIGEINRKKEGEKAISYFGFTYEKLTYIVAEYRRLYPSGVSYLYLRACFGLGFAGLAGVAACLMIRFR